MLQRPISSAIRRATILVVDDEDINRDILGAQLETDGHHVLQAGESAFALKLLETVPVDLVLLDVMMPGMDGYELCARIKQNPRNQDLPVVFVTSLQDHDSRVRGLEAGCDDFLNKPFHALELKIRVKNLLRAKAFHDMRNRQRELLEVELERIREQLLRADRLATLGTLAAGTGHELNNILSVLQMTVELMRLRSRQNPAPGSGQSELETHLARLDTVVSHISAHARTLLNYGRPGQQRVQTTDLCEIVNQSIEMLRISGRIKGVQIEFDPSQRGVWVGVDRPQIEQVLVNLIFNAVDAVAENKDKPRQVCIKVQVTEPGRAICSVADNGCGIAGDKLGEIFNPYYTTKPQDKGTGLGLPVVKTIVEAFHGNISVTSREGLGTTASFTLPCVQAPVRSHAQVQN